MAIVLPVWSVYVKSAAPIHPDESWSVLDGLADALDCDRRVLGCSAARESDGASLYVSVEADDVDRAVDLATGAAADALRSLSLPAEVHAPLVFDEAGTPVRDE